LTRSDLKGFVLLGKVNQGAGNEGIVLDEVQRTPQVPRKTWTLNMFVETGQLTMA
jgi:hypothetical protein